MSDAFITMVTAILALIIMFVFPLAFIGNQSEIITGDDIRILADDFVNKASKEGKIIYSDYYEFLQKLNATGNSYKVSLEVQILDNSNLSDARDLYIIGENMYYSEYTTAIEERLEIDGEYILKQGDYVKVKVENTNVTFGTQVKRLMYGILGKDVASMDTNSSAIVISPSLDASQIAVPPEHTIDLTDLDWRRDYYWQKEVDGINDEWNPTNRWIKDGSISRIRVSETETGSDIIEMMGNSIKAGKGAAWAPIYANKIKQISFSYDLSEGDSFYDAGILFNIDISDEKKQISGYLISFNFNDTYGSITGNSGILSRAGYTTPSGKYGENETGAIMEFKYYVGRYGGNNEENKRLMKGNDYLRVIETFNASREGSGLRGRQYKGKVKIKVTNEGYHIMITNGIGTYEYDLKVEKSKMKTNTIGFFSEHHSHNCTALGYFKLYNVRVIGAT